MNSTSRVSKSKEADIKQNTTSFNLKTMEKTQPTILQVECNKEAVTAHLSDSRVITIPTGWYKVLREANAKQLKELHDKHDRVKELIKVKNWSQLDQLLLQKRI